MYITHEAILGSTTGALLVLPTIVIFYILCLRRDQEVQDEHIIQQLSGLSIMLTFEQLQVSIENFVKELEKCGFGTVFEGRLGNKRIAVKRLNNVGHENKDFLAKLEMEGLRVVSHYSL